MKLSDIKNLGLDQIKSKLVAEKANYDKVKMNHFVTPLESPIQLKTMRKTIARLATELTIKQLQVK